MRDDRVEADERLDDRLARRARGSSTHQATHARSMADERLRSDAGVQPARRRARSDALARRASTPGKSSSSTSLAGDRAGLVAAAEERRARGRGARRRTRRASSDAGAHLARPRRARGRWRGLGARAARRAPRRRSRGTARACPRSAGRRCPRRRRPRARSACSSPVQAVRGRRAPCPASTRRRAGLRAAARGGPDRPGRDVGVRGPGVRSETHPGTEFRFSEGTRRLDPPGKPGNAEHADRMALAIRRGCGAEAQRRGGAPRNSASRGRAPRSPCSRRPGSRAVRPGAAPRAKSRRRLQPTSTRTRADVVRTPATSWNSVPVKPGQSSCKRTPVPRSSSLTACVKEFTNALVAA